MSGRPERPDAVDPFVHMEEGRWVIWADKTDAYIAELQAERDRLRGINKRMAVLWFDSTSRGDRDMDDLCRSALEEK